MAVIIAINKAEADGDSDEEVEEIQNEDEVCACSDSQSFCACTALEQALTALTFTLVAQSQLLLHSDAFLALPPQPRAPTSTHVCVWIGQMVRELMLASGVYDPSHVFPEAIKMKGSVQKQSMAALRTGYRMLCDVEGNASLSDKHQQVPLSPPSSPVLALAWPAAWCRAAVADCNTRGAGKAAEHESSKTPHPADCQCVTSR